MWQCLIIFFLLVAGCRQTDSKGDINGNQTGEKSPDSLTQLILKQSDTLSKQTKIIRPLSDKEIQENFQRVKEYSHKINMADPFDEADSIEIFNDSLAALLENLLRQSSILDYNIEKMLSGSDIIIHTSPDRKLRVFNWYTNNGGTFRIYYEILFAQTLSGPVIRVEQQAIPTKEIYAFLRSKDTVYLLKQSGLTCSTCGAHSFLPVSVSNNEILEIKNFFDGLSHSLSVEARTGNLLKFAYNPSVKEITVEYIFDDLNSGNDEQYGDTAEFTYQYTGNAFVILRKL